jgi:hypothetical protein
MSSGQEIIPLERLSKSAVLGIFAGVFILWALTGVAIFYSPLEGWGERGQFGDLFGSINALFSGLAFAGVIVAIMLQREELSLQRLELAQTRQELAKTAKAQDEAQKALNKTMYAQSFKVAIDIIESPEAIDARRRVFGHRDEAEMQIPALWQSLLVEAAENVIRNFETVGTLIRRGTLPAEFIVETWSVPIVRNWRLLEKLITSQRLARKDPYVGRDFEYLYQLATNFLKTEAEKPQQKSES